jgi:class 3 adenylate cyclase
VGNIQAVDRTIWTAIGNTTNLAARLQSLTRELDAALVIDASTWRALRGPTVGLTLRPQTPIRGRGEPEDVYLLPLDAVPAIALETRTEPRRLATKG